MKLKYSGVIIGNENKITGRITNTLFVVYLLALIWILLFKLGVEFSYMKNRNVNLIPFRDFFDTEGTLDVAEIIMNIIIFVPLCVYAGVLFRAWSFSKKILFFLLVSSLLEGIQFMLKIGAFDITDIINNTLGGITGLILFKVIDKVFNDRIKSQKFINMIAAAGTVIMISLLLLLKLNMLPVRYQ
jgi:glycopeptide antibiotics resistance protein